MVRVYLVHEYALLRAALRSILAGQADFHVVGEAENATRASLAIPFAQPDLVLTGLSFPDFDGTELTRRVLDGFPETKVIAVTARPERTHLLPFLQAGGLGYLNNFTTDAELLQAIDRVIGGDVWLSPDGVQLLASQYRLRAPVGVGALVGGAPQTAAEMPGPAVWAAPSVAPSTPRSAGLPAAPSSALCAPPAPDVHADDVPAAILSSRERQVLHLVAHGYSSPEIGAMLFLSDKTVDTYRRRIRDKLHLDRKADLLEYAIRHHIFEDWE